MNKLEKEYEEVSKKVRQPPNKPSIGSFYFYTPEWMIESYMKEYNIIFEDFHKYILKQYNGWLICDNGVNNKPKYKVQL